MISFRVLSSVYFFYSSNHPCLKFCLSSTMHLGRFPICDPSNEALLLSYISAFGPGGY